MSITTEAVYENGVLKPASPPRSTPLETLIGSVPK